MCFYWVCAAGGSWLISYCMPGDFWSLVAGSVLFILFFLFQFRFVPLKENEKNLLAHISSEDRKICKLLRLSGLRFDGHIGAV